MTGWAASKGIEGRENMASEKIKTFTDADFERSVKDGVVLVDFWAEWCAPCRRLAPTVDQLAEDYHGRVTVAKVNIDENPMTPNRFFIRGIPTLLLFKDGDLKETIVGLAGKDDLVRVIDKHVAKQVA
jgi:thioredoxin 1